MYVRFLMLLALVAVLFGNLGVTPASAARPAAPPPAFAPVGTYATGLGGTSGETVALLRDTMYITNSSDNSLDIVDVRNPALPTLTQRIDLSPYGAGPNSVAANGNLVAVAVEAVPKTDPGSVVFFDRSGTYINRVRVGALPDMLTFTPNGQQILVANEGEPNDDYTIDPYGSVSIIPVWMGTRKLRDADVVTVGFEHFEVGGKCRDDFDPNVRIFGPTANHPDAVQKNLEPEYITISDDNKYAYVTLQENNALAVLDLRFNEFIAVTSLGLKDHSLPGNGLDASDRDGAINIANWPVFGMYQPDTIDSYRYRGKTFLVTANEGDARDYATYAEEVRVGSNAYRLDPTVFPNAAALKNNAALGRLTVSRADGDIDGDGDYDRIHVFGARSFSIWSSDGQLVYDSGDRFEQYVAATNPAFFNANNTENDFDGRSDNKGPEPEGLAVGTIAGRTYAFIGLERQGGVMIYDITNPNAPTFVQYTNNRVFSGATVGPDSGPEVLVFVPAARSPTGKPTLLVANEISGTVTIYSQIDPDGAGSLTLLHNNDGESSLLPINTSIGGVTLPAGGVAAFKTLTDQQIAQARADRRAVVNVYAGDAFLASSTLACSLPPNPGTTPVYDAVAQRQIAYDAHILGNHEFDFGPDFLERFIRSFRINGVLNQPFLSSNLDFSAEPGFADLIDTDGIIVGSSMNGRVVSRSMITIDSVSGQRFGIVSAITPILRTISSPRDVQITTSDIAGTALLVQQEINRLQNDHGIKKIIFVSHLQDIANDRALIAQVRGIDIAVAGGGDELLANSADQLLPGEAAPIVGSYPSTQLDADGRTVYIVTTAGNYKYLGNLDVTFDANGEVASFNAATSYPRRVIPTSAAATSLGISDAVTPNPAIVSSVVNPVQACLAALQQPLIDTEIALDVSRDAVRGRESNAGNLIADAFLAYYDQQAPLNGLPARDATVIAVQNGGGIRQNAGDLLPAGGVVPGSISRQNTLDVLAFLTNSVTAVREVTPADLQGILERSASSIGGGQFLQIAGLRIVIDTTRPAQQITTAGVVTTPGERVRSAQLADGTWIIEDGILAAGAPNLTIVTNSFTAAGGDNYPWFAANGNTVQFPATYEQAWVEYLLSFPVGATGRPTIPAGDARYALGGEGRIIFVR
ncbi:MAG TPA: choice-of-anchor I family protein [Roseiflexaceae bacterium]|nr:choice-of-anchor I family protein [Roseiflexaceae bacterium]HMP42883.1 choice-of-anchor I family protein [Roseiflexaceae bacterium]